MLHRNDFDHMATTSGSEIDDFRRRLIRIAPKISRDLPWIEHRSPWAIFVSEVMLQQTQVERVIGKWRAFIREFPSATACASAPLADVLALWSGLGYPRRARALHESAKIMVAQHRGRVPRDLDSLLALPGIGPYTARAVLTFAFNEPVGILDTNAGRVLARAVANKSLLRNEAQQLADLLVPVDKARVVNQALLDLGAQFCTSQPNCQSCLMNNHCRYFREGGVDPAHTSAAVSKPPSKFEGSSRQLRGLVLRELHTAPKLRQQLEDKLSDARLPTALKSLERDGLIERRGKYWCLPGDSRPVRSRP